MPTQAQWDGVLNNNSQSIIGTWTSISTNYSSGRFFGPSLMLPAAGGRVYHNASLFDRDLRGFYWSSTESGTGIAWYLRFSSSDAILSYDDRRTGRSLRCVAE